VRSTWSAPRLLRWTIVLAGVAVVEHMTMEASPSQREPALTVVAPATTLSRHFCLEKSRSPIAQYWTMAMKGGTAMPTKVDLPPGTQEQEARMRVTPPPLPTARAAVEVAPSAEPTQNVELDDLEPQSIPPAAPSPERASTRRTALSRLVAGAILAGCVAILALAGRRALQRRTKDTGSPEPSAPAAAGTPSPPTPPTEAVAVANKVDADATPPVNAPAGNASGAARPAATPAPRRAPPSKTTGNHASTLRKPGKAIAH
jgi:hypothetical protein